MYILLYVNQDNQPCYLQGTIAEINKRLAELWEADEIDRGFYSNFQLLAIEDGALTPVEVWETTNIPQVTLS